MERYNKKRLLEKETPKHHKTVTKTSLYLFDSYHKYLITNQNSSTHNTNKTSTGMMICTIKTNSYKHNFDKPPEQIEDDDIFTDSHVSDKLRSALIDLWTVHPQLPNTSLLPKFRPLPNLQNVKHRS